jgi:hypothetical protein
MERAIFNPSGCRWGGYGLSLEAQEGAKNEEQAAVAAASGREAAVSQVQVSYRKLSEQANMAVMSGRCQRDE